MHHSTTRPTPRRLLGLAIALAVSFSGLVLAIDDAQGATGDTKTKSACYAKATKGQADSFKTTTPTQQRAAVDRLCRETVKGIAFYNAKGSSAGVFVSDPCVKRGDTRNVYDCPGKITYNTPTPEEGAADSTVCTMSIRVTVKDPNDWRDAETFRSSIACVA